MKKLLLLTLILTVCMACLSSCKLINKLFPCKHKNTVTDAAVAATCTQDGLTEGSHCVKCGEVVVAQKTITALGHTEVVDNAVTATCSSTGLTEGKHCSVCNSITQSQAVVPEAHNYGEWTILTEATCFSEGEKTRSCNTCNIKENTAIAPIAHSFVQNEETKLFACEYCDARIYAGHLYAAFNIPLNWYDAYIACEKMGGHLVTITSDGEQVVINDIISSKPLPSEVKEYFYWAGGLINSSGWKWITGEAMDYTNWGPQGLDGSTANWHIALTTDKSLSANSKMQIGDWEDLRHTAQWGFICEWELNILENEHFFTDWKIITEATCFNDGEQYRICTHCGVEETETIPRVEHNFIFSEATGVNACEHCSAALYNGHIYKTFEVKLSWFDAYKYCNNLEGHLATITTAEEQVFIETYMSSQLFSAPAWIGLYTDGDEWQWVTDETFEYTNWGDGEPNCNEKNEYFGHIINDLGNWNDVYPFDDVVTSLICEWEA